MNGIEWLNGLGSRGMVFGLDNITELLRRLGDPQNDLKTIHVAGTDGKGSTCAMIHSVLRASGVRTGSYTSPHIMRMNERIVIDEMISDDEMDSLASEIMEHANDMEKNGMRCTFFEVMTAMAFLHFSRNGVEYAIVEVGMGGRFDATNVVVPEVSVITNISLEHTAILGDTVEKIAEEKAGIIKPGIPVVTANGPPALDVIERVAEMNGSEVIHVSRPSITSMTASGVNMKYDDERYIIPIPGRHQAENAAVAIETLKRLSIWNDIKDNVRDGLSKVNLEGRMERDWNFILDVTHTAEGSERLANDIIEIYGNVTLIIGLLEDKDHDAISRNLSMVADKVYVTAPNTERALDVTVMNEFMTKHHNYVMYANSVADAMQVAIEENDGGMILVTGSFYMVQEAKEWLRTYAGY